MRPIPQLALPINSGQSASETIDQLVNNADVFTFVKDESFQITSRWEVDAESQHCLAWEISLGGPNQA
ncbi:MAG: hypothetical protein CBB71_08290 [Rhodopirellula sp. TMED11]|nr:MAG: hypothetical protein CBB71_08290 [Rhodopirellula sp. TMED11]